MSIHAAARAAPFGPQPFEGDSYNKRENCYTHGESGRRRSRFREAGAQYSGGKPITDSGVGAAKRHRAHRNCDTRGPAGITFAGLKFLRIGAAVRVSLESFHESLADARNCRAITSDHRRHRGRGFRGVEALPSPVRAGLRLGRADPQRKVGLSIRPRQGVRP